MRARRLRRLGLVGGGGAANPSTTTAVDCTMPETMDENNSPAVANAKNLQSHDSEESDDAQHKQKQLKFDNESTESVLNNNETIDTKAVRTGSHRSRLLDELERQRIENSLNQNVETTESSANVSMEMDELAAHQTSGDKGSADGDSGIENMETDEPPSTPLTKVAPVDVELDNVAKEREAEICLSRILDAFWSDYCEGQIIVTETANCYKDFIDGESNAVNFSDLTFHALAEIAAQYYDGKIVDFKASSTPKKDRMSEVERMDTGETSCTTPNLQPHNLPDQGACNYLIQAFKRSSLELDRYSGARSQKKFGKIIQDAIYALQEQIVRSTVLILTGKLNRRQSTLNQKRSVLLDLLYEETVPFDFFHRLVDEVCRDEQNMTKIFGLMLNNLFLDMQGRIVGKRIDTTPIHVLSQLLDLTVQTTSDTVIRPFGGLLAKMDNFFPTFCTDTPGREIVKVSYLGPFLSLSVLSEENPKLFEDEDEDWDVNMGTAERYQAVSSEYFSRQSKTVFHWILVSIAGT